MRLNRLLPAGPPATPEELYTGLDLAARAPAVRPYVVGNFVASVDGKATLDGRSAGLSGEVDRRAFHLLRTQVDAVLAGTQTLRLERYGALVRDPELRRLREHEGRAPQPLAAIVSRSGDVPYDIPLFADPDTRVALYAPSGRERPACTAQVQAHEVPAAGELAAVLGSLRAEHGVRALLCEGGPTLFDALLADGLVDELFLTVAPTLVGGGERGITAGVRPPRALPMRLVWVLECDGELLLRYAR
ncbi:MAG TPA: dihydrofolate reductase family protein [Solirubrobacteraceae bacterium]|nr:dihydrofolate reductase family protein [Solirubrobacteraceae bacterium]